jgi:hypothetical protein
MPDSPHVAVVRRLYEAPGNPDIIRQVPRVGIVLGVVGVAGAAAGLIQPVLFLSVWYIAIGLKLLCGESFGLRAEPAAAELCR